MRRGKRTVVPRLRFPEFHNAPGWETTPLEGIAERVTVKNTDGEVIRVLTNSAEYGVLDQRDYFERDVATAGKVDGYYIVDAGDYVYNPRTSVAAPVGPISRNNIGKGVMSPLYTVFRFSAAKTDFYEHFFRTTGWHSYVRSAASTGARHDRMSITTGAFMRMPVPTPPAAEQQKIADCLTSLDELIAAQERKVEALKTYKRGLMQQLFPREGETLPRLRFPEFRDAPQWAQVKAGTLFANRSERGDDSLPIYSVTMTEGLVKRSTLDRRIDDIAEATGNKRAYRYDIAYNMMRMWQGACGVAFEGCMVSPAYVVLSPQTDVHAPFYGHLFKLPHMLRLFTSHSRGLTEDRLRLYYQDFASIPLPQPDAQEQERIADCLSALDARISIESESLDALKGYKIGLMQQLFPAMDDHPAPSGHPSMGGE